MLKILILVVNSCLVLIGLCQICNSDIIECGTVTAINDLILGGNEVSKGAWPFAVVISRKINNKFLCGGTLISKKHVLTAAHCVHKKFERRHVPPTELLVHLGVHNLTASDGIDTVQSNVTEIFIHSGWQPFSLKYDGDVSILVLPYDVIFTTFIRPICMPADFNNAISILNGTVVGWGKTVNENSAEIPRQATVNIAKMEECVRRQNSLAERMSGNMFCGEYGDGIPNHGDSGGGLFIQSENVWVQYGIISAFYSSGRGRAFPDSITMYANVSTYKNWIKEVVRRTEGAVSEVATKMNLFCDVGFGAENTYKCVLRDLDVQKENTVTVSITGNHRSGNSNEDVELLTFDGGSVAYIPNKIGFFFPNLKIFIVPPQIGINVVKRSNFQNMRNLVELQIFENNIASLDADSLWDLRSLEMFQLKNATVEEFDEQFFEKNENLKRVNLNSNALVSALPKNLFRNNPLLSEIVLSNNGLWSLDESFFDRQIELESVNLSSNSLRHLPKNLFKNNLFLHTVDLSDNWLYAVDEQMFVTNEKLRQVDLSVNRLESIPKTLFESNPHLSVVNLAKNSIKVLGEEIFASNVQLKQVSFAENQLEYLPRTLFRNCSLLEKIVLQENSIKSIDEDIFEANYNLRIIYLNKNQLEILPKNLFKHNALLVGLSIDDNSLKTIYEEIFAFNVNLKNVYINNNQLEFLPKNLFRNNSLLETIAFHNNAIESLDEQLFAQITNLKRLGLSENKLESLPKHLLRNNPMVETLVLGFNFIRAIDEDFFKENHKFRIIYLNKNQLEILPKNLFKHNALLVEISIDDNSLKTIDEETFSANVVVKNVYISNNKLDVLPRNLFRNNLLLEEVAFHQNSIVSLDEHLFEQNTNLKNVDFSSNKLESLGAGLFKNNLLLENVFLASNNIKLIECDFSKLSRIKTIILGGNDCISSSFTGHQNLTSFQEEINNRCSST